jgi:hypothetical protein
MGSGPRVALALGVGYLLGRRRKRKLAMTMGTAALAGGAGGAAGQVLRRGAKMAGSSLGSSDALSKVSPGIGEISGIVRGQLLEAGKAAAMAAVNSRIDSLTNQLHERAETLRNPAAEAARTAQGAQVDGDESGDGATRRPTASTNPVRNSRGATDEGQRTASAEGRRTASAEGRHTATAQGRRPAAAGAGAPRARQRPAGEAGSAPPVRRAPRSAGQGR